MLIMTIVFFSFMKDSRTWCFILGGALSFVNNTVYEINILKNECFVY